MEYPTSHIQQKTSKSKSKSNTKCSWCDRKRARNDLCNVCRQKVESRARRLMEQKLEGDMDVVQKVMRYLNQNISMQQMTNQQTLSLILQCFPFLMLKYQSENTYRGKKGNRCWCLPESVLKKLITQFYVKDKPSLSIIQKGGRNELCDLLMSSVTKAFNNYGITNIKPLSDDDDNTDKPMKVEHGSNNDTNSGKSVLPLKRTAMESQHGMNELSVNTPSLKRMRMNHPNNNMNMNHNRNEIQPDHQIWGRSDTELLSFDINKLDSFLHKFEREVLDGAEWEKIEPSQRVDFLKGRCKEFTKILTELRDYVIHLREQTKEHEQNKADLETFKVEVHRLKQKMEEMVNSNPEREKLYRCVTKLLTTLAPNPVDTVLLRGNMDKLEQYHDLACKELSEAVHSLESIGAKMGYQRSSDMTLKQYASHLHVNMSRDDHNKNRHGINALYMQSNQNNAIQSGSSSVPNQPLSSFASNNNHTPITANTPSTVSHLSVPNQSYNNNNRNVHHTINNMNNNNRNVFQNNNHNHNRQQNQNQTIFQPQPPPQQQHTYAPQFSCVTPQFNNFAHLINTTNPSNPGAIATVTSNNQPHRHQNHNHNQQTSQQQQQQRIPSNIVSSPTANFVAFQQPTIALNAATLNTLGITIPNITSINPGQHLPTRFNGGCI